MRSPGSTIQRQLCHLEFDLLQQNGTDTKWLLQQEWKMKRNVLFQSIPVYIHELVTLFLLKVILWASNSSALWHRSMKNSIFVQRVPLERSFCESKRVVEETPLTTLKVK